VTQVLRDYKAIQVHKELQELRVLKDNKAIQVRRD
jgi:hypothetical protein